MKVSKHILVYYTFQLEDNNEYNVYKYTGEFEQPSDVRIIHVIKSFPFDGMSGQYHYRFKSEFKEQNQNVIAWIDISNMESKVPLFNNAVYVKILKVKNKKWNRLFTEEKLTKAANKTVSTSKIQDRKAESPKTEKPVESATKLTPQPIKKLSSPEQPKKQINNDLLFEEDAGKPIPAPSKQPAQPTTGNVDLMFEFKQPEQAAPSRQRSNSTEEKLRILKQSQEREEQEKENDMKAKLELQDNIEKWAYTAKVRNNFRTLIVTVHELWPYNNWSPVALSDLLTDKDLRKYHMKAQLVFHPDKNREVDYRRRYLSKRISSELSEAFKKL